MLASPFVGAERVTDDTQWSALLLGSGILVGCIFILCRICEKKMVSKLAFPILTAGFCFGGILMTALGRSGGGSLGGRYLGMGVLGTQYCPLPIWFAAAIYLMIVGYRKAEKPDCFKPIHNYIPICLFIFFSLISLGYYDLEAKPFLDTMKAAAYTLQHYEDVPESMWRLNVYPGPFDDAFFETVPYIRENHYFLFGSDKEYTYPYDDYVIAERRDNFTLPGNQIAQGDFVVDSVNGIPPDGTAIVMAAEAGLDISMWATDSLHGAAPTTVLIETGGEYHELKPYERPDVAQAFGNYAYVNSGFRGYVATRRLAPGTYPVNLIVVCEGGASFYAATIANLEISQ